MTTVAIVGVLSALALSGLAGSRKAVNRVACINNLKQLQLGAIQYSADDTRGNFSDSLDDRHDNFNFLFPQFVDANKTFVCPATRNLVVTRSKIWSPVYRRSEYPDLSAYAGNPKTGGTSYELFGFMNAVGDHRSESEIPAFGSLIKVSGVRKSIANIASYNHRSFAQGLGGTIVGPSAIFLFSDGDEPPGRQNFPDANNNHGAKGLNVAFCDGHVEWVQSSRYLYVYEKSQDENRR